MNAFIVEAKNKPGILAEVSKAIADKLYTETAAYMRLPETLKTLTGMGVGVDVKATAEVRKFVRDEIVKWRKVAIDAKMPREVN